MKREIFGYGCSHTAGYEMGDHIIDADEDRIKIKKGQDYWLEKYRDRWEDIDKVLEVEHALAWPRQVADRLGIERSLNRAREGSSLSEVVYHLESDLLSKDHSKRIYLVGVPEIERVMHFSSDAGRPLQSVLLAQGDEKFNRRFDLGTLLEIFNDAQLLWQWTLLMLRLTELSDRHQQRIKMFFMRDFGENLQKVWPNIAVPHQKMFQRRLQHIQQHPSVYTNQSLYSFEQLPKDRHGGGHVRAVVHERFGTWVASQLAQEQSKQQPIP